MGPTLKKHSLNQSPDESVLTNKKRKLISSEMEEMNTTNVDESQGSTVLFELENNLNSSQNYENQTQLKTDKKDAEPNIISNTTQNDSDEEVEDKSLLTIKQVLYSPDYTVIEFPVNECSIKQEIDRDDYQVPDIQENNVEQNNIEDGNISDKIPIINHEMFNADQEHQKKKKKKKKKHKELEDSVLENDTVSENPSEETNTVENAEENDHITEEHSNRVIEFPVNECSIKQEIDRDDYQVPDIQENNVEQNNIEDGNISDKIPIINHEMFNADQEHQKKKKKKKKKHKELEDSVLENDTVSENPSEETNTVENAEENDHITEEHSNRDDEVPVKNEKKNHEYDQNEHDQNEQMTDGQMPVSDTLKMFEEMQQWLTETKKPLHLFWTNFKFEPYDLDTCKLAFENTMRRVSKKRTPLELVNAGEQLLRQSPSKIVPKSKPPKPVTAYKIFHEHYYEKISKKNPECRTIEILNKISQKWHNLSNKKKLKYIDEALSKRTDYLEAVKSFQIDPEFKTKPTLTRGEWRIKDKHAGLPDFPPFNGLTLFRIKSKESYSDLPNNTRTSKVANDFKSLPIEVKNKYKEQAKMLQEEYEEALKPYLDSLSPIELDDRKLSLNQKHELPFQKSKKMVKPKAPKLKKNILQKKPPTSGYMLFSKEIQKSIADVPFNQKNVIVSKKWKALTQDERNDYIKQREELYKKWKENIILELQNVVREENNSEVNQD